MNSKVLLASVALLAACQGHKDKATRTPESVPVRLALPAVHAALNTQAQRLSLADDTTKYTYLPFHLVIRASNGSGFSQSVVVKPEAPEVALELPTGPVKIEALVFGMPMPAGMSKAQMCAREGSRSETTSPSTDTTMESTGDSQPLKNDPGGAMVRTYGAPRFDDKNPDGGTDGGSTGTATSGGGESGEGGMKFLFVSQLVQNVDVQAGTDVLPVSLPALKIAKMESLGVRVTNAGKPVANASFKLVDTLSYKPIVDPCDGTAVDIRTDGRGRIVDTLPEVGGGVPLFAIALPKGGFAALDVTTTTLLGRFKELKLDTGVVSALAGTFDFFGAGVSLDAVASKGLTYVTTLLEALRRSFGGGGGSTSTADGFWSPGLPLPAPKTFVMQFDETLVVQPNGWLRCGSTASFDPWRSGANIAAEYRWTFKGSAAQAANSGDNQIMPDSFIVPASAAVGDVVECQSRLVELNAEGAIVGAGSPWSVARVSVNSSTPAPIDGMGGPGQTGTGGTGSGPMNGLPDPENVEVLPVGPSGSMGALVRFQFHPTWDPNADGFSYSLALQGTDPPACPLTANSPVEVDRQTFGLKLSGLTINTNYLLRVCSVGIKEGVRLASMGRVVPFQTPSSGSGDASLFDASIPTPEDFGAYTSTYEQVIFQYNEVTMASNYRVFYSSTPDVSLQSAFLNFGPNETNRWHTGLADGAELYYRIVSEATVGGAQRLSFPSAVKKVRVTGFRPSPLSLAPEAPASFALRDVDGDMSSSMIVATKRGISLREFDGSWRHFTVSDGLLNNDIVRVRMQHNAFNGQMCAVHAGGGVSYSWDRGSSWFTLPPGGTPDVSNATTCDFLQNTLLVGRSSGPLVWKPQFGPAVEMPNSPVASDIASFNHEIFVAGPTGLHKGDGRGPWQTLDASAWTRVHSNNVHIVAAGASGKVGIRKNFYSSFVVISAFSGSEIQGLDIFYTPNGEDQLAVLSNGRVFTYPANGTNPNSISEWINRGEPGMSAPASGNALAVVQEQFAVASSVQGLFMGADTSWSSLKPSPHAAFIESAFETFYSEAGSARGYAASGTRTIYSTTEATPWSRNFTLPGITDVVRQVMLRGSPWGSESAPTILAASSAGIFAKQGTNSWSHVYNGGSVTNIEVMKHGIGGSSPLYVAAADSVLKRSTDGLAWNTFSTIGKCTSTLLSGPFTAMASGEDFIALGKASGSLALLWKTGPSVNEIACTEFLGTALGIDGSTIVELAAVGRSHDGVVVGRSSNNVWFVVRKPSNMPTFVSGTAQSLAAVSGSSLGGVSRFGNEGIALGLNLASGESRVFTLGTGSIWTQTTAHVTLPKLPISKMFPYGDGQAIAISYANGADGRGGLYVGNLPPNPAFSPMSPPSVQLAFVTSTLFNGNLGGRAGADGHCTTSASAESLGGTWKALLSTSAVNDNAINHISITGQVRLRSGEIVVSNPSQLWGLTEQFASLFYRDEYGEIVPMNSPLWTGTGNTGGVYANAGDCSGWTSNLTTDFGTSGSSNSDVSHFNSGTQSCNTMARLICIQNWALFTEPAAFVRIPN